MAKRPKKSKGEDVSLNVWAVARTVWENSTISYRELEVQLKSVFGDDNVPNYASIQRHAKKHGWSRENPNTTTPAVIDGETGQVITDTYDKVKATMDSVQVSSEQKKKVILENRHRLHSLGEMFNRLMEKIDDTLDMDIDENPEKYRQALFANKTISEMLNSLGGLQKILGEQQFAIYQITADDFGESATEKRAASLALLEGINEEQRAIRQAQLPDLINRLKDFENLNLDDVEWVENDDDEYE